MTKLFEVTLTHPDIIPDAINLVTRVQKFMPGNMEMERRSIDANLQVKRKRLEQYSSNYVLKS